MHWMRQVWAFSPFYQIAVACYVVGSVPGLHPETQTVDEMLEDWRNQQLCRQTWIMTRSRGAA